MKLYLVIFGIPTAAICIAGLLGGLRAYFISMGISIFVLAIGVWAKRDT